MFSWLTLLAASAEGTIAAIAEGVAAVAVNFGEPVTCKPNWYQEIICDTPKEKCSSDVVEDKCSDNGRVLRLVNLLPAAVTAGKTIKALLSTNEWVDAAVTAVDVATLTYTVTVTGLTDECIVKVCTPTAVDGTCPACENANVPCSAE